MRILITRTRQDSEALADKLAKAGVQSLIDPLLDIKYTPGAPLDLDGVQVLLMTSANGVRAFCHRSDNRTVPVYAVGDASAQAAKDNGFQSVCSASGDVNTLAELVHQKVDLDGGALLHCAGTNLAGDLATMLTDFGYAYRRAVLYAADKADQLGITTITAFEEGDIDGVVLFSPRTAELFADLITAAGLNDRLDGVTAYCLSINVDRKISHLIWKRQRVADLPQQDKLISEVIADYQR